MSTVLSRADDVVVCYGPAPEESKWKMCAGLAGAELEAEVVVELCELAASSGQV